MQHIKQSGSIHVSNSAYVSPSATLIALTGCSIIMDDYSSVFDNSKIACEDKVGSIIRIGSNSRVQRGSEICGNVCIGSNVIIGPNCFISSGQHIFALDPLLPIDLQDLFFSVISDHSPSLLACQQSVIIEDNAYIGKNVVILPGTVVARGSVIAANSVVNANTTPYSVYGGSPARRISTALARYT
jgi:acetyltransferase-like isoleucine patch superfamily enzyme